MMWKIWIDTGGTFTDCIAVNPQNEVQRLKVLSDGSLRFNVIESVDNTLVLDTDLSLRDSFLKGYQAFGDNDLLLGTVLANHTNQLELDTPCNYKGSIKVTALEEPPVLAARLATNTTLHRIFPKIHIKLGSTRGTNALLESKGNAPILIVSKGFKDLLEIGTQQRPHLFALEISKKKQLYKQVVEIEEYTSTKGEVLTRINKDVLESLWINNDFTRENICISFKNATLNPCNERLVMEFFKNKGVEFVSASHELSTSLGYVDRTETTVVNSYLQSIIEEYVNGIKSKLNNCILDIMSSSGGLLSSDQFYAKDSLLSGPAGGVIGASEIAKQVGVSKVLTLDMGGDLNRCCKILRKTRLYI